MSDKYFWTVHARLKLKYYGLSESRIKRIIHFPARTEEGIVENTVAVMQPAGSKRYTEIWAMYKLAKRRAISKFQMPNSKTKKIIKIITVWRYPGKSPARNPIPAEVLKEIKRFI
ncbi:MAG: hypothetical protein AAB572_02125 [Patescibacteria group bacterium]